jgi:hypothetical protein
MKEDQRAIERPESIVTVAVSGLRIARLDVHTVDHRREIY